MASGVTVITFAKVWFVIAGYALYLGLTRLLGPRDFGLYAVVTSVVSVLNNVLIAATLQAVSRFTARDETRAGAVLRGGLLLQVGVGAAVFLALETGAPLIAGLLRDPGLVSPLRVVALVIPAYALYAVAVGYLNGLRRFRSQAALDGVYSTLRAGLQLGAVALGFGVIGALAGFAGAAFVILGVSLILVARTPRPGGAFDLRELLAFGGWLVVLTLLANLVLTADLWIVKRLSPPAISNQMSGLYRAALTLSQLLYQLLIPMALVLFPSLSHLGAAPDPARARSLVRGALRYLALALIPGATILAVMGPELISLLYGRDYREGGVWLRILAPAYAAWTAAYLLAIALAGAGQVRTGVIVLALGLAGQALAGFLLCARFGPAGAAWGSLAGMGLALGAGAAIGARRFGAIVPWASLLRACGLAALLAAIAAVWPAHGLMAAVKAVALAAVGVLLLALARELPFPGRRIPAARS